MVQYARYLYDVMIPRFGLLEKGPDGEYLKPMPSLIDDFLVRLTSGRSSSSG